MKKICELGSKELERHAGRVAEAEKGPRYICCKCARVAATKQELCKPLKLRRNKQKARK